MKGYKAFMKKVTKAEIFVLCVITVLISAITFMNVLSRFVFHASLSWSEELVINIFILMIMLGVGLCHQEGSMITLSLVFDNVGIKSRKVLVLINTVVDIAFYWIVITSGMQRVMSQIRTGAQTFSLGWPTWMFTVLLPIGCVFAILHVVEYMIDVFNGEAACIKELEGRSND